MNLVKYADEFWITLSDFTQTRDTEGYSNSSSIKSAIRTYVVRQNPDLYISFRGEKQLKNIIQENKSNPLFHEEDFKGHTRTGLISFSMVESLDERFKVSKEHEEEFDKFMQDSIEYVEKHSEDEEEVAGDIMDGRSSMLKHLRNEMSKLDREIEVRQSNREKIMQAINSLETLETNNM